MENERQEVLIASNKTYIGVKRLLSLLLIFVMLLEALPMTAWAAWDGSGSTGGTAEDLVDSDVWLVNASEKDIMGYRLSVYDGDGNKQGHSADVEFKQSYAAYRFTYEKDDGTLDKKSHIDLYREYQTYSKEYAATDDKTVVPRVSLGDRGSKIAKNTGAVEDQLIYYNTDLKLSNTNYFPNGQPSEFGNWIEDVGAAVVAKEYCGVETYDSSDYYIIVEPLFLVYLVEGYYHMTVAELAVFQADAVQAALHTITTSSKCTSGIEYPYCNCGWTRVYSNSTYCSYVYNLGNFTSGIFPRYLYAVNYYDSLNVKPVLDEYLAENSAGDPTLALPNKHSSSYRNCAESLLKYQCGMGIYTKAAENGSLEVNYYIKTAPSAGYSDFSLLAVMEMNANVLTDYDFTQNEEIPIQELVDFFYELRRTSTTTWGDYFVWRPGYTEINGSINTTAVAVKIELGEDQSINLYFHPISSVTVLKGDDGISNVSVTATDFQGLGNTENPLKTETVTNGVKYTFLKWSNITINATLVSGNSWKRWTKDDGTVIANQSDSHGQLEDDVTYTAYSVQDSYDQKIYYRRLQPYAHQQPGCRCSLLSM